jgi:predicted PurR-regulated permease PerM
MDITRGALRRWFVAQCYDSAMVGALWWLGLEYLHLPWVPFWAILAALLQFIPHIGPVLAAMGPAMVALFVSGFEQFLYVIILYGGIVVIDGLLLQPVIMRRTAQIPIWASLIIPILLGILFGFWALLLAGPLLVVIFAYRAHRKRATISIPHQTPPGQEITGGRLVSPGYVPPHNDTL